MMPLYHTPPAHTKPTPGVFIGAAWLGWTLGVCGCPPGPAQTVGGLRLHLRLRVGLRLSHSDNLSSHIPIEGSDLGMPDIERVKKQHKIHRAALDFDRGWARALLNSTARSASAV